MTTAVVTTEAPQELAATRPAQGSRRRPPRATRPVGGPGASLLLWGYAALALVPLLLMVSNSFRSNADLITDPLGLPAPPTTASYVEAWTTGNFATYFGNSLAVTVGAVAISTAVATMAAYALARGRSRIFRWLESLFLSGLHAADPPRDPADLLPLRRARAHRLALRPHADVRRVGHPVLDLRPDDVLPAAAGGARGGGRPRRREQLADLLADHGAARAPALATVAVFRFVPIWNDFLFPLVLLRREEKYTLPVGLTNFFGENATNYSAVFAGLVITTIPLIVLFLVATKQIVAGLTAGMAK